MLTKSKRRKLWLPNPSYGAPVSSSISNIPSSLSSGFVGGSKRISENGMNKLQHSSSYHMDRMNSLENNSFVGKNSKSNIGSRTNSNNREQVGIRSPSSSNAFDGSQSQNQSQTQVSQSQSRLHSSNLNVNIVNNVSKNEKDFSSHDDYNSCSGSNANYSGQSQISNNPEIESRMAINLTGSRNAYKRETGSASNITANIPMSSSISNVHALSENPRDSSQNLAGIPASGREPGSSKVRGKSHTDNSNVVLRRNWVPLHSSNQRIPAASAQKFPPNTIVGRSAADINPYGSENRGKPLETSFENIISCEVKGFIWGFLVR